MKVKEITYMVLDMLKGFSDDFAYTEEHIIFLCKKYRAFLIKKEQEKLKGTHDVASVFEQQQICLDLERTPAIDGQPCTGGYYLKTVQKIPTVLEGYQPRVYPLDFYQGTNITFVARDRMRYVGSNPYLRNIIYASIEPSLHLYLYSSNPQFLYLKKLRMTAVFEDFDQVSDLLCDDDGGSKVCDVLDMEFPIREYLVPMLIELVVKEISGTKYAPTDSKNNAADDLSNVRTKE